MAERKFLFMAADGYSEEAATADHAILSGLVIGSGSYSAGKITGVTAGSAAGDAIIWGQAATMGALTLGSDDDLTLSGGGEVLGLPATPSGATAAASKAYVDSLVTGLKWRNPASVLKIKSDADQSGVDPTAGAAGEAWVVNNWATETDGDIVEWSGSAWVTIVANSGGEPPDGTRAVVIDTGAAGSFNGEENNIGTYDATGDSWSFDTVAEGWALLITGESSYYENIGWTYDNGSWIQFTGAGQINAGAGLSKDGNTLDVNFGDGITNASDYVALDLAGANPGLQLTGTTPAKVLSVLPDTAEGIDVDAQGVKVKLETDGGLQFDGTNGGVEILLEATNPTLEIDGTNHLKVKYSASASGLDQDANGLKAKVDGTTIQINGSGQLEVLGSGEANKVAGDYTAAENVAAGDAVYWEATTANRFGKGDADGGGKQWIFGIATETINAGNSGEIVSHGPADGVISGATQGDKYYLQDDGTISNSTPGAGKHVVYVGHAMDADTLWVQLFYFGKKAA
jgi:hypothetical protein